MSHIFPGFEAHTFVARARGAWDPSDLQYYVCTECDLVVFTSPLRDNASISAHSFNGDVRKRIRAHGLSCEDIIILEIIQ